MRSASSFYNAKEQNEKESIIINNSNKNADASNAWSIVKNNNKHNHNNNKIEDNNKFNKHKDKNSMCECLSDDLDDESDESHDEIEHYSEESGEWSWSNEQKSGKIVQPDEKTDKVKQAEIAHLFMY